jgi:hypothetical protein
VARVRQRMAQMQAAGAVLVKLRDMECRGSAHLIRVLVTKDDEFVKGLDTRQLVVWNGPDVVEEFSLSLVEGDDPCYEISYQGSSPTREVKVQAYAPEGVGEDSGVEMEIE